MTCEQVRGFLASITVISRHSSHFPPRPSPTHSVPSLYSLPLCVQCSASCGNGMMERDVSCIIPATDNTPQMTVNDSQCDTEDMPTDTQPCNLGQCPYTWRITRYTAVRDVIVCTVQWGVCCLVPISLSITLWVKNLVDSLGKMSCFFLACGISC